ncbi:MAG: radical SAM protein [candidate division Zixibacteria bacterium]|nr:radical SAM protein [candidate division Zixibacteria bacterium]
MKLLLIHPPSSEVYDKFKRKSIDRLPIGLAYIAAAAENTGWDVEVIDAEAEKLALPELVSRVNNRKPDAIGITCTTPLFPISSKIASLVKGENPDIVTILGGPHINALPSESLRDCADIDFVVFGEGEQTFAELLESISKGITKPAISGIGYRQGSKIILNSHRNLIRNIDSIPFPARHKFPLEKYHDPDRYNEPYTLMVSSRGCPYNCIFCGSSATWGRKVRFRSADNVLDEIDIVVNQHGIRNITFCDDTFTLGKKRVIDICSGIAERGYNLEFLCSSRINTIDENRLEALAKAGCKELSFGIESADEDILHILRKNIDLQKVIPIFEMVKRFGIRVHSSYILGNPGDTRETIEKTIEFAIESGTDAAQFSIMTPYPGTPLWNLARMEGALKSNEYSDYKWYYSVVANLSEVSDQELIDYQREAYNRFERAKQVKNYRETQVAE